MRRTVAIIGFGPNTPMEFMDVLNMTVGNEVDIMVVGLDAAKKWVGAMKYVVTNHAEDIPAIMEATEQDRPLVIAPFNSPYVDVVQAYQPIDGRSGSSAMTAVLAAIRIGYEKIILCGVPLTGNAPEGNPYEAFRAGWEDQKDDLMGKVKSMSGWTAELLGTPSEEWLNG